jgi:hypothetical protein
MHENVPKFKKFNITTIGIVFTEALNITTLGIVYEND